MTQFHFSELNFSIEQGWCSPGWIFLRSDPVFLNIPTLQGRVWVSSEESYETTPMRWQHPRPVYNFSLFINHRPSDPSTLHIPEGLHGFVRPRGRCVSTPKHTRHYSMIEQPLNHWLVPLAPGSGVGSGWGCQVEV